MGCKFCAHTSKPPQRLPANHGGSPFAGAKVNTALAYKEHNLHHFSLSTNCTPLQAQVALLCSSRADKPSGSDKYCIFVSFVGGLDLKGNCFPMTPTVWQKTSLDVTLGESRDVFAFERMRNISCQNINFLLNSS